MNDFIRVPKRKKTHEYEGIDFWKANGWNDCLNEIARMNDLQEDNPQASAATCKKCGGFGSDLLHPLN